MSDEKPECVDECDYEWIDDSFSHEYGTEVCGHWECKDCGDVNAYSEPPSFEYDY